MRFCASTLAPPPQGTKFTEHKSLCNDFHDFHVSGHQGHRCHCCLSHWNHCELSDHVIIIVVKKCSHTAAALPDLTGLLLVFSIWPSRTTPFPFFGNLWIITFVWLFSYLVCLYSVVVAPPLHLKSQSPQDPHSAQVAENINKKCKMLNYAKFKIM